MRYQIVMKISHTVLILGILSSTVVCSQELEDGEKRPRNDVDFIERFDTDGDGLVSATEREAAGEKRNGKRPPKKGEKKGPPPRGAKDEERHEHMLERFDEDGDGELSEKEREAAKESLLSKWGDRGERKRQHLLEKYDADGDGELSDEERAKARKSFEKRRLLTNEYLKKAKEKFMADFDSDLDGEFNAEEMQEAKKRFSEKSQELRNELVTKYDKDGDGKLSEKERGDAHAAEKHELLERFDVNGDGDLSGEERRAAFDAMLEDEPYRLLHMMIGNMRKENDEGREGPPRRDGPPRQRGPQPKPDQ